MKRPVSIFSLILYICSGLTLLAALILLVSALGFSANAETSLMILRGGLNPIANMLVDMLLRGIQSAGVALAVLVALLSLLLFVAGRLTARARLLSLQVSELAARVSALEQGFNS